MASSLSLPAPWVVVVLMAVSVATLTSGQCTEGTFGLDCRHRCHCVNNSTCDVSSGKCEEGCQEGYSGPWCQRRNVALGTLAQNPWNRRLYSVYVDGNKETCSAFSFGNLNVTLNSTQDASNVVINIKNFDSYVFGASIDVYSGKNKCAGHLIDEQPHVLHTGCDFQTNSFSLYFDSVNYINLCEVEVFVCEPGFHGDVCDQLCGHCRNADCNQRDGACTQGCEAGYTGSFCNQTCAQSTYGDDCSKECGHCIAGSSCDSVNGVCAQGCEAGYTGSFCNQTCAQGIYGGNCITKCGHCVTGSSCDPVNGTCVHGCEAGFTGSECKDVCTPGRYGQGCSRKCGHCGNGSACDPVWGTCSAGCEAGFTGGFCHEMCYNGTYGENCGQACPPCGLGMICHHVTGMCPEMTDRQDTGPGTRMGTGVGVGVAVCVGVMAVVIGLWYLLRKRGYVQKNKSTEPGDDNSEYLTPIPFQARTIGTRNENSDNAYNSLELSTRNTDNPYQGIESPYEEIEFGDTRDT